MEAKAVAKYIRISPRKAAQVADLVRGKSVGEAYAILKFTPNKGAAIIEQVLKSAVANAEHNYNMDVDKLYVTLTTFLLIFPSIVVSVFPTTL